MDVVLKKSKSLPIITAERHNEGAQMSKIKKPADFLGKKAKDKISGFTGIITCASFWVNGCIRLNIAPQALHEGKVSESSCFDDTQVEILGDSEVKPEKGAKVGGPRPAPKDIPDPK